MRSHFGSRPDSVSYAPWRRRCGVWLPLPRARRCEQSRPPPELVVASALVAAACTIEAVARAAEASDHATLHRDPEFRARRAATNKCIAAQLEASRECGVQVAGTTEKQAKQFQRGRKFKHVTPDNARGRIQEALLNAPDDCSQATTSTRSDEEVGKCDCSSAARGHSITGNVSVAEGAMYV